MAVSVICLFGLVIPDLQRTDLLIFVIPEFLPCRNKVLNVIDDCVQNKAASM